MVLVGQKRKETNMSNCISQSFYRDLKAARKSQSEDTKSFTLTKLTKAGTPSGMHDATQRFATEAEALEYVSRVRTLNPARTIRWTLNGVEV